MAANRKADQNPLHQCVLGPGHYAALARFAAKRRTRISGETWLPMPPGGLASLQLRADDDRSDPLLGRRRPTAALVA
jgi:hypothetical protein